MPALRRLIVLLTCVVAFTAGTLSPASAAGNDYPWRLDTTQTADPWGFTKRQCVSWVAFRMSQRGVILNNWRHHWGSADNWDNAARRMNHGIGPKPVIGAIAHWNAGERAAWYANGSSTANGTLTGGPAGHVGYVQGVHPDGSAVVTQYNLSGTRGYSIVRVRAPRYLYVGVRAPR